MIPYEQYQPSAAALLSDPAAQTLLATSMIAARAYAGVDPLWLHLGCGTVHLDGWVNMDMESDADLVCDLRFGLPFPDDSADLIHSEHVFEHFLLPDAMILLAECRRVLKPGGTMRIAMPDLDGIVGRLDDPEWRALPFLGAPLFDWVDTPVALFNLATHGWGHLYMYNETELTRRVREAGFTSVRRATSGESSVPGLAGLETRPETDLVLEVGR